MKRGLILEGGGMRGLFTAGILDAWMEAKIPFDGLVGVSAGACFGCNYKSHQFGRVIRYNKRLAKDARYCSWTSLLTTGDIFNADFCYREVPFNFDPFDCATFNADPMEFHISATDCATGKAVYRRLNVADAAAFRWIQASASMPIVSRPVPIDGRDYLDGGLSDGIPLGYFEKLGYTHNVIITTRPHGYRKFPTTKMRLLKPFLRKYPAVYEALVTRHRWYNETLGYIDQRVAAGAALHIAPPETLAIGRVCHNPDTMQRIYDLGMKTGQENLPALRHFLEL